MNISIVIPAYNEEKRIGSSLERIINFFKPRKEDFEVIVVDDGSNDNTFSVSETTLNKHKIENFKIIRNKTNLGKGRSVKEGIMNSKNELIFVTDADLSTPIEEYDKFLSSLNSNNADIVIGSRALRGSKIIKHQPLYREVLGKLFNKFLKLVILSDFNDTQCGAKLFKKEVAQKIFTQSKINKFAYDVETLYLAKKYGYRTKEIPVRWCNSPDSRVRTFIDGIKMIIDVMKIRCQFF